MRQNNAHGLLAIAAALAAGTITRRPGLSMRVSDGTVEARIRERQEKLQRKEKMQVKAQEKRQRRQERNKKQRGK